MKKKLTDVISFKSSIGNINIISKFFQEDFIKLKKKITNSKKFRMFLIHLPLWNYIGSTSTSITLSKTRFALIVVPTTAGVSCGVAIGAKLVIEFFEEKNGKIIWGKINFQIKLFKVLKSV